MVQPQVGSIVLVRFPFSDLSGEKLRPAFVVADVGRSDWILCQLIVISVQENCLRQMLY